MSELSSGLSRGGAGVVVYTYREAAQIARLSLRTFERAIAEGWGPEVLKLSPRRRGVTDPALRAWLKNRPRKITVVTNAGAESCAWASRFAARASPSQESPP